MAETKQETPVASEGPMNPSVAVFDTPLGRVQYSSKSALFQQVGVQMAKGAGYAALVFFVPVLFVVGLWAIGQLLPEESKQAPDPSLETTQVALPARDAA